MKSRDFCFWLQGYFEIFDGTCALNAEQVKIITSHLALVFEHEIDPAMGDDKVQAKLNAIHNTSPDGSIMRC